MAAAGIEAQSRGSAEFAESSVLEAIVPSDLSLDIQQELNSWDGAVAEHESGSILPFLPQREVVLLDELLSVFIVFRTPCLAEELLRNYLERLLVNVEAFAFSTAPPPDQEGKGGPSKELIHAQAIHAENQPLLVRHGEGDAAYTYVIWKVEVFIARPHGRFHKPAVYFQPIASFKPAEVPKKDAFEDDYLPSHVPTALNLLQSFEGDPALYGVHPRLSAMRINKITPSKPAVRELARPIKNGQRLVFRVLPALIWRIRYSRLQTSSSDFSIMASLDLEVAQYGSFDVRINEVSLSLHGGKVKSLASVTDSTTVHKPGDQLTFLYNIRPDQNPDGALVVSKGHYLTMRVAATVVVSEKCQPNIAIEWKTPVDFAGEQIPSSWKIGHRSSTFINPDPKMANPDSLPPHDSQAKQEPETGNNEINITLTVTGPPRVQVGKLFTWDVFIVNRSEKSRKLAILVMMKRKRDYDRHKPHPSTASVEGSSTEKKDLIASAVLDENIVYARQKGAKIEAAELICLTTDIRLGQLSPGSCYMADLKFLALSAGVLGIEALRVVDLATNETADIRDLPSIVAVEEER